MQRDGVTPRDADEDLVLAYLSPRLTGSTRTALRTAHHLGSRRDQRIHEFRLGPLVTDLARIVLAPS